MKKKIPRRLNRNSFLRSSFTSVGGTELASEGVLTINVPKASEVRL
jgi:hypothetical protein